MGEEKQSFIDRLGPTLTSGLLVAFLSAASLGAISIRDLVITTNVDNAYVKGELDRIRSDLNGFKAPGGRFTKEDGDRHQNKLDELERRVREQETRPPRLNPALEKLEEKVHAIEEKQSELCQRLKNCNIGHTHANPSTSNTSGNRGGY